MADPGEDIEHLTLQDVLDIHDVVLERDENASPGVLNEGHIQYALDAVRDGHVDEGPETIYEKAYQLLRLLAANHPFADGNKRTALNSVEVFYGLNGYELEYGEEAKMLLKVLAVTERFVDATETAGYLEEVVTETAPETVVQAGLETGDGAADPPESAAGEDRRALIRSLALENIERHRKIYEDLADE